MTNTYSRMSIKTFKPATSGGSTGGSGGGTGGGQTPVSTEFYYVDAVSGDDANDGLSPAKAIQTLTRVNSLPFTTTRKVLFKRGQSWIGTITLNASGTAENPVIIDSYGSGALPVIEGSTEINGWTLHQGNIYKASFSYTINQLFVNNNRMQAARFPATGFATVTTAPSTSSLTCNELDGVINHTGAKCLIHSSSYGLDTKDVTASVSKTLTLNAVPFGNVDPGEKFILVGKLEYLTAPGQWYYDSASHTVYLWKTNGSQPAAGEVRGSIVDYGFVANGKSFFQVRNIEFDRHKVNGIHLTGCSNFNVNNVSVNYPDSKGIRDSNSSSALFHTNTVRGANHLGIESYTTNSTFLSNYVYDTCLFQSLGHSGIGSWYMGSGIYVQGNDNIISTNRVHNVGYNGIHFANRNFVEKNYVTEFCLSKNDGGGIYTSAPVTDPAYAYGAEQNKGSIIRRNICLYGRGITTTGTPYAEGVYLDESSGGVTVDYNTVGYLTGRGIFDHKGNSHVQRNNILFMCETGLYISKVGDGNEMTNNIVYAGQNQVAAHLNALTGVPIVNNNLYINHYHPVSFRQNWGGILNFSTWKTNTAQDAGSTVDESALPEGYSEVLLFNPGATSKRFWLNAATNVINDVTKAAIAGEYIDVAANSAIIVTGLNVDCIQDYADSAAPVILSFEIDAYSNNTTVYPSALTSSGAATKFKLTETNVEPALESEGWAESPSYTFDSEGAKTLYAWARDAAGNISASASATITIEESVYENLVAWYDFENPGITLTDLHTNNLDGSNKTSAGADRDVTTVPGKPGEAYPYISTGLSRTIIPDNTLLDFEGEFSIGGWVNVTSLSGIRVICSKANEYALSVTTTGAVEMRIYDNAGTNFVTISSPAGSIVINTDYLIMVKALRTDLKSGFALYINGVAQTLAYAGSLTELTAGIVHTNNEFIIGFSSNMAATMYGKISQLVIWSKAISQNVMSKFYNNGNGINYPAD